MLSHISVNILGRISIILFNFFVYASGANHFRGIGKILCDAHLNINYLKEFIVIIY